MVAELKPGARAPAFTLTDQKGKKVKLSDYKGKRVVVYFYPKADTPGCTTQSCSLRDAMPDLKKLARRRARASARTHPRSRRSSTRSTASASRLLADTEHQVAEKFGVWGEKSMYGKKYMGIVRSAFVIDEQGKIAAAFYKVSPKDTVPKVSGALEG